MQRGACYLSDNLNSEEEASNNKSIHHVIVCFGSVYGYLEFISYVRGEALQSNNFHSLSVSLCYPVADKTSILATLAS